MHTQRNVKPATQLRGYCITHFVCWRHTFYCGSRAYGL